MDDDPIGVALQSRRIPHGRSRNTKGSKGSTTNGPAFNPLRTLGRYEVQLGSGKRNDEDSEPLKSWLEIHELTPNDDGFLGTFDFGGKVNGMLVLAGSRKGLASIINDLEDSDGEEDDDDEGEEGIEAEDERINRRARAFEKNTFRNPKFWMRWKGSMQKNDSNQSEQSSNFEIGTGYLVFSGNDCERFEGTVSSTALEWDNLKMRGWKVHSKATKCPLQWKDFT